MLFRTSHVFSGMCRNEWLRIIVNYQFKFGTFQSAVHISPKIPSLSEIALAYSLEKFSPLVICDENTAYLADAICASTQAPRCILPAGEKNKNWASVERILRAASDSGLGRDGLFVGVGGGVVGDLSSLAASIYKRGCNLCLVSTTLLGMVDASVGGKTGIDLFGVKNLAGTFYPARHIFIPIESLATLPLPEWKSGMAELIKTAVLSGDAFLDELYSIAGLFPPESFQAGFPDGFASRLLLGDALISCIAGAIKVKGRIVSADPMEMGNKRMLLNLGHTFAHSLEAALGLGAISHGEAVAWGIARSCELGLLRHVTPQKRAEKIIGLLKAFGYEIRAPYPVPNADRQTINNFNDAFIKAMKTDKKKKAGKYPFIVPNKNSAVSLILSDDDIATVVKIINGI